MSRKKVSVSFAGDDDVMQHIVSIRDRRKSLRSSVKATSVGEVEEHSDDELKENEEVFKPSSALSLHDGLSGTDVFGFKTPKKSQQMALKASESVQNTPKTPKSGSAPQTPKSILKKTPGSRRGSTVTIGDTPTRRRGRPPTDNRPLEARTPHRLRARNKQTMEDMSSDESISSESDEEKEEAATEVPTPARTPQTPRTPGGRKRRLRVEQEGVQRETVESYFDIHSSSGVTSDRTLSRLENPRLDHGALAEALAGLEVGYTKERAALLTEYSAYFNKWMVLLCNGFNILFHGVGSKRKLLEFFRNKMLKNYNHIVINGFFPSLTVKSILNSITDDILDHRGTFKSPIDQCAFIKKHFECGEREDFYLIINNIDGSMLRPEKAQTVLSLLAQVRGFHVLASIDHINAPLIWDQTKMSRFNWLWYDVTTFEPYQEETSYENSLMVQQSGALALSSLIHVMRSLTPNAKKIFVLLVNHQLENKDDKSYQGLSFPDLYQKCRENFLVNSDVTLRQQLTEFKDHKLVKFKRGIDGVEYLSIPLDELTLKEFLEQHGDND